MEKEQEQLRDNRISPRAQIGAAVLFVIFSAAAFYLMECYEHNPFVQVRPKAQLFNILLFELTAFLLYLLCGGMRLAIRIELASAMLFGLVNHYVTLFRSTPFVPWDVFSIRTAASVAGQYDFTPGVRVVLVSLGFVLLFVLAELLKAAPRIRVGLRLAVFLPVAGVLVLFANLLQDERFQIRNYLYPYLFTPGYMTKVNGMAVTFVIDLQYLTVEKPGGYDAKEAEKLLASYEDAGSAGDLEKSAREYPNIIVIMDEAFSDLSVLGELDTDVDYMPFYHELQRGAENTVTGYAQVSVRGGNTANSEFEFLTGCTMAFLPDGSIPYQQYINGPMPSLASHLAGLGYETYAQHPYQAGGWNRDQVYPWMGFAHADFLEDYGNRAYVRTYVSDASDFIHVIETIAKKPSDAPAFVFNVTMQNHGGYTDEYDNFTADVHAAKGSRALDNYLSLLRLTDQSLRELVEYLSRLDEPTLLVFFGDHQPNDYVAGPVWKANGIDPESLTEEQQKARCQVPYLIWANYDIPSESGADTSLNYLGAHMLALAGVPLGACQNYLCGLEGSCPVISAAGRTAAAGVEEETIKEQLLIYQRLQYYLLFDYRE